MLLTDSELASTAMACVALPLADIALERILDSPTILYFPSRMPPAIMGCSADDDAHRLHVIRLARERRHLRRRSALYVRLSA